MKDPGKRWKTQDTDWEKTFSNCISKKRLVSKYITLKTVKITKTKPKNHSQNPMKS